MIALIRHFSVWTAYFGIGLFLVSYVRSRRFDIVHAVLPGSYVVGSLALLTNSASGIMSRVSLNWYQRDDWLFYCVERFLLHRRLDAAVCNCRTIANELENEGVKADTIHVIHNGIDTIDYASRLIDRETARQILELPDDAFVVSAIANFHKYKGHANLLRAIAGVDDALPNWRLVLVGRDVDGHMEEIRQLGRRLNIADRVIFLGERDDVPIILSAVDLHVSSSMTEGLPNNIIEAMCAGLAVVATDVGGTSELVDNEKTGLLVPSENTESLGRAICRLANDAQSRLRFGIAGSDRILQRFQIDQTADAFLELYRTIGARRRLALEKRRARYAWIPPWHRYLREASLYLQRAVAETLSPLAFLLKAPGRQVSSPSAQTTILTDSPAAKPPKARLAFQTLRNMTVDVVIPVRNRALFIGACLDSVRAQTLQPNSVIVVDDGSTDGTPDILEHYAKDWDKLRVIKSVHRGVSAARNLGVASSSAELIAMLDSDDLWHREKLARQVPLFTENESAPGLVHCGLIEIDEYDRPIGDGPLLPWKRGELFNPMLDEFYHILGSCSAAVVRRNLLIQVGGFDESMEIAEDCDLFFRLARISQIDYVPEALIYLRRHPQGTYIKSRQLRANLGLLQRLEVWNKYFSDVQDMDGVKRRFRTEAVTAGVTNLLRFNRGANTYDELRHSQIDLANDLFADHRDYYRQFVPALLNSIVQLAWKPMEFFQYKHDAVVFLDTQTPPPSSKAEADFQSESELSQSYPRSTGSDVSAVVFSMGEDIEDAIEHINHQSYAVHEIFVVRNFSPFHKALNAGASLVRTKFFIQVDSDMRLDTNCVETLRAAMKSDVGIVVGYLRDSLMKTVVGIKLFRAECFSNFKFQDSISPDTDFVDTIAAAGWKTVYVGNDGLSIEMLGDHSPNYTPAYTYRKYLMEGKRYRYRHEPAGLLWHLHELELSSHPSALIAQIGICRGIFLAITGDELGLENGGDEFNRLNIFIEGKNWAAKNFPKPAAADIPPTDIFQDSFSQGRAFFLSSDRDGFLCRMNELSSQGGVKNALLAKIALCQGLLSATVSQMDEDYSLLADFVQDPSVLPALSRVASGKLIRSVAKPIDRFVPTIRASQNIPQLQQTATFSPYAAKAVFDRMARTRSPRYEPLPNKIAMVTGNLGVGGSERQMVAAVSGLIARNYSVSILALEEVGVGMPSVEEDLKEMGAVIEVAPRLPPEFRFASSFRDRLPRAKAVPEWLLENIATVGSHIERLQVAIMHCWLDHPSIYGGFAGCVLGVPRILFQFGSTSTIFRRNAEWAGFWQCAYRSLSDNPSIKFLNNSRAGARDYEKWIGMQSGSIGVLYNGFTPNDTSKRSPEATLQLRALLGLPTTALVIGTVMRFAPEKDPHLWLETAALIAGARSDVRFVIFGYGPLEHEILERIKDLRLQQIVTMAGATNDAGLAYSLMDVVLLTSSVEGVPNVSIEAQAEGLPVVVPDVGGTSESVDEHVTGLVARPRSPKSLAAAVLNLINRPDWRQAIKHEGPQFINSRFGLDRMVEETVQFYATGREPIGFDDLKAG